MTLPIRLHPLAEADLLEAWSWYEQRQVTLGDRFLASIKQTLERVAQWPDSGAPAIHDSIGVVVERRVPVVGFPYAIRYRTIEEMLVVTAVYHQRRHPDFGTGRST